MEFTRDEVAALEGFFDRVDLYDYMEEFEGLDTAIEKIRAQYN